MVVLAVARLQDASHTSISANMVVYENAAVARRAELARFLRARRDAMTPEQVGLVRQPRRRVSGLRRHEVADLAAVSDTWYTWLEQGRDIHVSAHSLDAVARALQLDEHAWRHLRLLAGVPVVEQESSPEVYRPELVEMLDDLLPHPACLTTVAFDLIAWNRAYTFIGGDPSGTSAEERNALWVLFTNPGIRARMDDWDNEIKGVVARFRFESGRNSGDPRFAEIVEKLSAVSPEFRRTWDLAEVRPFVERAVTFQHPAVGPLRVAKIQMRPIDQPNAVLTVHRAADDETRRRLETLLATG
jgi:transcriptional regulator with XRE-family HTH domain